MSEDIEQKRRLEKSVADRQGALCGDEFKGASLSRIYLVEEQAKKMSEFLNDPEVRFLVFLSPPGEGKTYFCSALIEYAMAHLDGHHYWHEAKFLSSIREAMDTKVGDYLKTVDYMIDHQLLIYDDIGYEKPNDWRDGILSYVVNERFRNKRKTVFTSNFTISQFNEIYHERVCSRLFASCNRIIEISQGQDLRKTL